MNRKHQDIWGAAVDFDVMLLVNLKGPKLITGRTNKGTFRLTKKNEFIVRELKYFVCMLEGL